jgi:hypothetical protein
MPRGRVGVAVEVDRYPRRSAIVQDNDRGICTERIPKFDVQIQGLKE